MKNCTKCGVSKDFDNFVRDPQKRDGMYSSCKDCNASRPRDKVKKAAYDRQYRKSLGWKKVANRYGVTEQYLINMYEAQSGKCAICLKQETAKDYKGDVKRIAVDHRHKCGTVRGLLCQRCNTAIGNFKDSPGALENAISYLKRYL